MAAGSPATRLPFAKYHGLGNDFVVVDLREGDPWAPSPQEPAVVSALCDRRFGVGADGVLAILPPVTDGADARMRVLNADGSEAEMCGNGLRCVAKHLRERDDRLARAELTVDTGAGPLACGLTLHGDAVTEVTVAMGRPRLSRAEIPMTGPADQRCLAEPLTIGDQRLALTGVSMGNPHAVAFVDATGPTLRRLAELVGPSIERHPWFPRRTNVELARMAGATEIELVVWERGVGITLACGTGACATVVAACLNGHARVGRDVTVHLLGGDLAVQVTPEYDQVYMRGAATHVFDAEIDLAGLMASRRP